MLTVFDKKTALLNRNAEVKVTRILAAYEKSGATASAVRRTGAVIERSMPADHPIADVAAQARTAYRQPKTCVLFATVGLIVVLFGLIYMVLGRAA
jgi:hypothetical protein